MSTDKPVLFLLFNRPDLAARVFGAIRDARVPRLYIAVDGPREGRPEEKVAVEECRSFAGKIDWPCEVKTLFRDSNLGCGKAVSSAIEWFFEHEEAGMVLEDDCLPGEGFFQFTSEMLDRYADNPRIMFVAGTNHQHGVKWGNADYYFSRYESVWGWASWRRAWNHYDFDLTRLTELKKERWLEKMFGNRRRLCEFWYSIFDMVKRGKIDTWDYQWRYSIWKEDGIAVIPQRNLISNLGFGDRATHTTERNENFAEKPIEKMPDELSHPDEIRIEEGADRLHEKDYLPPVTLSQELRRITKKILIFLRLR